MFSKAQQTHERQIAAKSSTRELLILERNQPKASCGLRVPKARAKLLRMTPRYVLEAHDTHKAKLLQNHVLENCSFLAHNAQPKASCRSRRVPNARAENFRIWTCEYLKNTQNDSQIRNAKISNPLAPPPVAKRYFAAKRNAA